jgi:membrane associated rhomboid family serine protease
MGYVCGECGCDAAPAGCPRCGGPVFHLDDPHDRENLGHYRAIRVDHARVWVDLCILAAFVGLMLTQALMRHFLPERDGLRLLGALALLILFVWAPAVVQRRRTPEAVRRLDAFVVGAGPPLWRRLGGSATFWIWAACLIATLVGGSHKEWLMARPEQIRHGLRLFSLLTGLLMHVSVDDVCVNALVLLTVVRPLERRIGAVSTLAVSLGAGIAGIVVYALVGGREPVVGGLGLAAAAGGCLTVLAPGSSGRWLLPNGDATELPRAFLVPFSLALWDFLIMVGQARASVPWGAHLAAFVCGAAAGCALRRRTPTMPRMPAVAGA